MLIALLPILAAAISTEDIRNELPISPADLAIVKDATARFAEASGTTVENRMRYVVPTVVWFPDKRCVVFLIHGLQVGGAAPIYCYAIDADTLIEVFDDGGQ